MLDNNVQCVTANLNKMFKLPLFVQDKPGSSVTFFLHNRILSTL